MAALFTPATERTLPCSPALRYDSFQLIFGSLVFVAVGDFGLAAVVGVLRPATALVGAKPRDVSIVTIERFWDYQRIAEPTHASVGSASFGVRKDKETGSTATAHQAKRIRIIISNIVALVYRPRPNALCSNKGNLLSLVMWNASRKSRKDRSKGGNEPGIYDSAQFECSGGNSVQILAAVVSTE